MCALTAIEERYGRAAALEHALRGDETMRLVGLLLLNATLAVNLMTELVRARPRASRTRPRRCAGAAGTGYGAVRVWRSAVVTAGADHDDDARSDADGRRRTSARAAAELGRHSRLLSARVTAPG